ncbi:hypothetical protein [Stagnihabitans tardus]|uniref:Uncharacterized protein n=1 Tax=Stagnihabitans tardus TaxID=2699202 RepID=A0AAE4Y651_9RHOB|nr:hypothetical protein [Stagnihabitans tardus]NBZ86521.1 hypothetical protein [Stagnihabitans tardus]
MTSTEILALSLSDLSDALQTDMVTAAEVVAAYGVGDPQAIAAAQERLAGDAPFLCGIPFRGAGLVAENLARDGAIPAKAGAFAVIEDWDGAALSAPLTFRPTPGLLPRLAGEGLFRALSEVPAIRAREVRDLRRILQAASLRRAEDPDQVPLPPPSPDLRRPCLLGAAVDVVLKGYEVGRLDPPWGQFGALWAEGAPEALQQRGRARADWAVVLQKWPLVALPTEMAGLVAGLGLPAIRVGGVILAARWFADERVLTAAQALEQARA